MAYSARYKRAKIRGGPYREGETGTQAISTAGDETWKRSHLSRCDRTYRLYAPLPKPLPAVPPLQLRCREASPPSPPRTKSHPGPAERTTVPIVYLSVLGALVCLKRWPTILPSSLEFAVASAGRRAQRGVTPTRRPAHDRSRSGLPRPSPSWVQAGPVSVHPNSRLSSRLAGDARIRKKGYP